MFIIFIYRIGNRVYYSNSLLRGILLVGLNIIRKIFIDILFQVDIPFKVKIGKGLRLKHPRGIVIHPNVELGEGCSIYHQVTIGVNEFSSNGGVARIGNNVFIGVGAKIIGDVIIGDNVRIGANAVVTEDVMNNYTVYSKQFIKERSK
ncbi:serine acetyltransferase [Clostridium sp. Sa3CUN1]|uniref:Serine acetyltransferase n=2 Tax=Clostridium gallinarum TaxID=2762246 RepID=A0ABR8Q1C2_9CLOT|nr:serine acetyltransferase [Clostridium gallinarum]